ncbi:MAG: hypothetical protein SNJ69_01865 [Chloroflexaceae bacterium]
MSARIGAALRTHWPLLLALGAGLALRLALWGRLPRAGFISDEAEYLAAADWLALGRGFAWHTQFFWTRAPMYPLFLAAHILAFGREPGPIVASQTFLSLLNVGLVYALGLQITGKRRAAGIAALGVALYLPFATFAQLLLTETLFITLLLAAMLAFGFWSRRAGGQAASPGWSTAAAGWAGAAGALLGLVTLTRGLTLGFVPLALGWVFWTGGRTRRAVGYAAVVALACFAIVLPWSLYASRAYGGPILVDTTGAFNLLLGARTAFDGGRDSLPTRNFVLALLPIAGRSQAERLALLEPRRAPDGGVQRAGSCLYAAADPRLMAALERPPEQLTQADRQRLMSAEAGCLLRARPLAFAQKVALEFIDLFRINYTGDERLTRGFALGHVPPWYTLALLLLDDTLYVLALPLAAPGWATLRIQVRARGSDASRGPTTAGLALTGLIGLWLMYNLGTAPLLFAINRFRVPLMPFVLLLAAVALAGGPWLRAALRTGYGAACAVLGTLLLLVATAPYAYLEPRAPGAASAWASYLGPYPSSLASSRIAVQTRPGYLAEQRLAAALGAGDVTAARAALSNPDLPAYSAAVGAPLLDGLEGRPDEGLDRLARNPVRPLEPWQTAVVAGELFRQMGEIEAARREFGPELVDSQNPVFWAWTWLYPPRLPDDRIAVADDNDLGYLRGFYLGGYEPALDATVRWARGVSALRFPEAGTGAPRQICLRLGGAWPQDLPLPQVEAFLDGTALGAIALTRELRVACLDLPARPPGATYVVELRAPTFVPDALDMIGQQGPQEGQLRLLAYQLDWAELR